MYLGKYIIKCTSPCLFKCYFSLLQTYPQWNLARNVIPGTAAEANQTGSLEVAPNPPKKMKIPKRLTSIRKIKDLRELLMSSRLYIQLPLLFVLT